MDEKWISERDVQDLDILAFARKVKDLLKERSDDIFNEEKKEIRLSLIRLLTENDQTLVMRAKEEVAKKVNSLMAMES